MGFIVRKYSYFGIVGNDKLLLEEANSFLECGTKT